MKSYADGKRGVFLVIYKQPGANVIATVDHIMAELPRLEASIPPAIKITPIQPLSVSHLNSLVTGCLA